MTLQETRVLHGLFEVRKHRVGHEKHLSSRGIIPGTPSYTRPVSLNALQAVLFDMDGAPLEPIDDGLPEFKARWGIAPHELVVPSLPRLPAAAELEFIALEARVARDSRVRPGFHALLADLERAGAGVGMVTNNSAESVNTVLEKHELPISVVRTRLMAR